MLLSRATALVAIGLLACVAFAAAGSCPGVCQSIYNYCPGSYASGLCDGGWDIKCCRMSTPSCSGQCQDNSLDCPYAYQSGKCPGGSEIQCCPDYGGGSPPPPPPPPPSSGGRYKMTHDEARSKLSQRGISVSSSGQCSNRYSGSCTSLDQVNNWTISSNQSKPAIIF